MNDILVNGVPDDRIPVSDRGLRYGDGLFETIAFPGGRAPLWPLHRDRLIRGCRRLGLPEPDVGQLGNEARQVIPAGEDGLVRLIVTRGAGGAGYFPPGPVRTTRIVQRLPWPDDLVAMQRDGLAATWCSIRLAAQPALAGIKHLNRLEQVLAAAECARAGTREGFLMNATDHLVEAVHANVVLRLGDRLVTPAMGACGVRGVGRTWLLEQSGLSVEERPVERAEAERAQEWMVINSVRGICPVVRLDERHRPAGPACRELQEHWNRLMTDHAA